ncbi:MAG: phosphoenolpyruvate synthase [Proteobacteria bacterium]|nr:phosphoenolpyruvate synthase [Pseudomonadota bacterium]MBI3497186.1 phosphoenolpyruvate synthase [Pseudomonadota bacterium]
MRRERSTRSLAVPGSRRGDPTQFWRARQLSHEDGLRRVAARHNPQVRLGTKAETLERLAPVVRSARVLPLRRFTVAEWQEDAAVVLAALASEPWGKGRRIVRSSARAEDTTLSSEAGRYLSVDDVADEAGLADAIRRVIASYGEAQPEDQVLVQPMLAGVGVSGVAFSRDPNTGSPYFVINYDDRGDTTAVTGGRADRLQTFVYWKHGGGRCPPALDAIVALLRELEGLLGSDSLDVEFAFDEAGLVLLQARPLVAGQRPAIKLETQKRAVRAIAERVEMGIRPHPYLSGERSLYGVMPDWNPAEIIGLRPRPLALSLYRDLVTDSIWAYQRDNYGYRNLRSFPLMVHFEGLPYIDVRVSMNSFVPRDLDEEIAGRLVNYYLDRLANAPALHDKVEFEIVFSCYTFDLPSRLEQLRDHGFSADDRTAIADSLKRLTERIIHRDKGLWVQDSRKVRVLEERRRRILEADLDTVSRIYWLLEDCKRYGTLPFAGLARAGFIAVQLLNSLVAVGQLSQADHGRFMLGLKTVGSRMAADFRRLDRAVFLAEYGHLRPGTYDILSPRYDEAPEIYFDWSAPRPATPEGRERFALSLQQMRGIERFIAELGIDASVIGLFDFLETAIEEREYAKFVFSRSLSDALVLMRRLGEAHGYSADEMSYANIGVLHELMASSADTAELLGASIERGRERYAMTRSLWLPPLIAGPDDVYAFHLPATQPNFIGQKTVQAPVKGCGDPEAMRGAIVAIPSADPGYDWIFTRGIAGFVTAYGGVNSHMAIRANELGLPAVIGAGEALFQRWSAARVLLIDCANQRVEVLG